MQVSTTISTTSGSPTATVASATGLFIGMYVNHPKVPFGTKINAIVSTTLTLSANATGTVTTSAARFSPIKDAQSLGVTGGALVQTTTLVTANLPPYTPAGTLNTIVSNGFQFVVSTGGFSSSSASGGASGQFASASAQSISTVTSTGNFAGTAQGGTSAPFTTETVQPAIVMNYIIKR